MKILFLHNGYESLGIEYLSASLKAAGFETALVIDPCLFDEAGFWHSTILAQSFSFREQALRQSEKHRPDIVAFSVFTDTFPWAVSMAREIKKRTGAKIVFGGIHTSSTPETVLAEDCVDFVCLGEGDLALPALAKVIASGGSLPAGIWGKKDGGILKGPPAAPPADINTLPFPDKELFTGTYPCFSKGYLASSSRGCPHSCAYCCNSVYRKLYAASKTPPLRRRSPDNMLAELGETLRKGNPDFIHFTDEVFNSDYAWLNTFLPLYRKKIGLPFSCYVFPDHHLAEAAPALAAAGCMKVQLGVQRFDEARRRTLLGRRAANADIGAAINALRSEGVYVTCDNILDLPDESEEELSALASFYAENTPDHNEIFFLRIYPNTPLSAARPGADTVPGGLMRPAGYSQLPRRRQAAYFSLLTLLPRLPRSLRLFLAHRPGLFSLPIGDIFLRVVARVLSRSRGDFHTGRFLRLYTHFIVAKLRGEG